jgi:L-asparaginase II
MTRFPELVGGTGRLCTELMRVGGGRIFAKVGAEGVYCAGAPGAELGIALKVEDGARRAAEPALLAVLRLLGLLDDAGLRGCRPSPRRRFGTHGMTSWARSAPGSRWRQ